MLDHTCLVKLATVDGCTFGPYQSVIEAAGGLWELFLSNVYAQF